MGARHGPRPAARRGRSWGRGARARPEPRAGAPGGRGESGRRRRWRRRPGMGDPAGPSGVRARKARAETRAQPAGPGEGPGRRGPASAELLRGQRRRPLRLAPGAAGRASGAGRGQAPGMPPRPGPREPDQQPRLPGPGRRHQAPGVCWGLGTAVAPEGGLRGCRARPPDMDTSPPYASVF